jgi:stage V sporulation protein G
MPSRKNPDDTYRDIVHPINSQFRMVLESAVIDAYNAALEAAEADGDAEVDGEEMETSLEF